MCFSFYINYGLRLIVKWPINKIKHKNLRKKQDRSQISGKSANVYSVTYTFCRVSVFMSVCVRTFTYDREKNDREQAHIHNYFGQSDKKCPYQSYSQTYALDSHT